jgi:hypothetical protein
MMTYHQMLVQLIYLCFMEKLLAINISLHQILFVYSTYKAVEAMMVC